MQIGENHPLRARDCERPGGRPEFLKYTLLDLLKCSGSQPSKKRRTQCCSVPKLPRPPLEKDALPS
eukprot:5406231-Amphidinium_carterae.1